MINKEPVARTKCKRCKKWFMAKSFAKVYCYECIGEQ